MEEGEKGTGQWAWGERGKTLPCPHPIPHLQCLCRHSCSCSSSAIPPFTLHPHTCRVSAGTPAACSCSSSATARLPASPEMSRVPPPSTRTSTAATLATFWFA